MIYLLSGQQQPFPGSRQCLFEAAVDSCPKSKDDGDDARFCTLYGLLVEHEAIVYKNPHCAACNGVEINQTRIATKNG